MLLRVYFHFALCDNEYKSREAGLSKHGIEFFQDEIWYIV